MCWKSEHRVGVVGVRRAEPVLLLPAIGSQHLPLALKAHSELLRFEAG